MKEQINTIIRDSIAVKELLLSNPTITSIIEETTKTIIEAYEKGNKILVCGNGGSAADAQHFVAEMLGKFKLERNAWPAIALTTNTSTITAIGNDYSYDKIFSRQLEGLGNSGDVFIGITTSGNSKNILEALKVAKNKGIITITLTGESGGLCKDHSDICIRVPSSNTPRIQESHIMIIHIICEIAERHLAQKESHQLKISEYGT